MCPLSEIIRKNDPIDMSLVAGLSTVPVTQAGDYQQDSVNLVWGQDCGGVTVTLNPSNLPFLSTTNAANDGQIDEITLSPTDVSNIGVYDMEIVVEPAGGYSLPVPGILTGIKYDF